MKKKKTCKTRTSLANTTPRSTNTPASPNAVDGFENVSDEHIAQFHAQGFLPIQGAYSSAQVNDGLAAVKELIAGQNREFRGVQFERGRAQQVKRSTGHARELLVRKLTRFVGFDPRLDAFGEDPQLTQIS